MPRKLPPRVKTVTFEGKDESKATFTIAKPTTGQVHAYSEGIDSNRGDAPENIKARGAIIVAFVLGSLNDANPNLNLTKEDVDNELGMDDERFTFLYREVLKFSGFILKDEATKENPTPAAS
jgi:hypothetical protein